MRTRIAGGSLCHAASFLLRNSSAFNWLKPYKKSTCQALTGANRTACPGRSSLYSPKLCLQGYRCNYIYYTTFLYFTQLFMMRTNCNIFIRTNISLFLHKLQQGPQRSESSRTNPYIYINKCCFI